MSNYGSLYLNNRLIRSTVEDLDWFSGLIFHAADQRTYHDAQDNEKKHVLRVETGIMMQRLNVLGCTDTTLKEDFELFRQHKIDLLTHTMEEDYTVIDMDAVIKECSFWKRSRMTDFIKSAAKLVHNPGMETKAVPDQKIFSNTDNYLMDQAYDLLEAMPFTNDLYSLRAFLSTVEPSMPLILDFTELYDAALVDDEDVLASHELKDKTIILTEGSSDIVLLKPALQFLFPHLSYYYSFFDFGSFNSQGGSGSLVNMIKSFAGAGISNKIIALFDNDTAAREAQTILKELSLPTHIKVLNCPHIPFAENYPTLGPTGLNHMDINGLACSIELYLGTDVLKDTNGDFLPILWKGYSPKMQAYQGEIMYKKDIQERFFKKIAACQNNGANIDGADWTGLIAIFEMIFDCFNADKNNYRSTIMSKEGN